MFKIVLLRHGESIWNKENRFTGWADVELSEAGMEEAKEAGQILKKEGWVFDLVYTSILKRAIDTTNIVLAELDEVRPRQIVLAWELNERHYGGLQGLNKKEMADKYGQEQVHLWRRSYGTRPPELSDEDFERQNAQAIFKDIPEDKMPKTESLADCYARAVDYWQSDIAPEIKNGKKVLVSAHGNSLRAIVKFLDDISDDEISNLNIPTGVPLVYELDGNLKPLKHYYLGDSVDIAAKIAKVKNQSKL